MRTNLIIRCKYCGATIFPSKEYPNYIMLKNRIHDLKCPVCGHRITKMNIVKVEIGSSETKHK